MFMFSLYSYNYYLIIYFIYFIGDKFIIILSSNNIK